MYILIVTFNAIESLANKNVQINLKINITIRMNFDNLQKTLVNHHPFKLYTSTFKINYPLFVITPTYIAYV